MKTTRQAILDQQALNRKIYANDTRYEKVWEQIELLGIQDVTTNRQHKNGTRVWKLPIKYSTHPKFIEVASFKTGYVRNQNGGYTNYQINKRCESEPQYYELPNGTYNKYTTKSCVLIPNEIDRLEYLIAYCLKNYYIKNANQVVEGKYVSKWYHDYELERLENKHSDELDCGHYDRVKELESDVHNLETKLSNAISPTKYECEKQHSVKLEEKLYNLQNKLATIERIANDTNKWNG